MSTLRVVTWNCFGAAQSARAFLLREGAPDPERFLHRDVTAFLEAADVVCVQELWVPAARALFERLAFAHKAQDHNRTQLWPPTIGGAGLGVASQHPLASPHVRAYSRPHAGAERFARKGALHVRLTHEGREVDVITTHLQAGESEAARRVRARHLVELRALIDEVGSPERPMIVCGDFNVDGHRGGTGEYPQLQAALAGFADLGARRDQPTFHPHAEHNPLALRFERQERVQRLDYLFVRGLRVLGFERALDTPLLGGGHASDHFALIAELELD